MFTPSSSVAPRAGAWIEIKKRKEDEKMAEVAPRAGAWIEIAIKRSERGIAAVAPRAGAWIEICHLPDPWLKSECRSPCGSVD